MGSERQEKIKLLSRSSKGKDLLPGYLLSLSDAVGSRIAREMLTGLQERDLLEAHFRRGYSESKASGRVFSTTYSLDGRSAVIRTVTCFADWLDEIVFLLLKESEYCGAVRMHGRDLLRHCAEILVLDGDSVRILSEDHSQGFLLDVTADDPEFYFELTLWGNAWADAMLKCSER